MRVNRMRLRFEDPHVARPQAEAIARRLADLIAGEGCGPWPDPADALARQAADRVSEALDALRRSVPDARPVSGGAPAPRSDVPSLPAVQSGRPSRPPEGA